MVRDVTLGLALALMAVPARADDAKGMLIKLPSGAEARWQETLKDATAGQDVTYRFRFVIPDLIQRIPEPGEAVAPVGQREPIDIDTETAEVVGMTPADTSEDAVGHTSDSPAPDTETEEAADGLIGHASARDQADNELADPLHGDVVWLCQNWALPRVSGTLPRPQQIIVSLSNTEVPFGSYAPDALQLFEAFALPADRDVCEWEPW